MQDWTAGYVADIGYTYGYYADFNPVAVRLALIAAGIVPPRIETACELGFGQGVSVNIHAAAGPARWWGTDFNPSQAAHARELADAAGAGAQLSDESFEEFCARGDLPDMDFIAVHGIWSWINDNNRKVIVDFARRKLKVGGVLYISYNTQPGWAASVPLRDLFTDYADVMGAPGHGTVPRIDAALAFAQKLFAVNPRYAVANPTVAERLKLISEQNRHYVAHEYFNRDWEPMSFARMAAWLSGAKLGFAASAHLLDHVDTMCVTPEQQTLLKDIPDPTFRQSVRDFCMNQQFRRDLWVRGPRQLNPLDQRELLETERVLLTKPAAEIKLVVQGSQGECKLTEAIYAPVIDKLSGHRPVSILEIAQAVQGRGVTLAQVFQVVVVLIGKGDAVIVQPDEVAAAARPAAQALNRHLVHRARNNNDIAYLASPVTGGGVAVSRFEQLFLAARAAGASTPGDWVARTWQALAANGQRLRREGKTLETMDENVAELTRHAREFADKRLPVLQTLQLL